VLVAISETLFTVALNKDARQTVSCYLIQLYANHLFISDPTSEFGTCMRLARREIDELLSFTVLDRSLDSVCRGHGGISTEHDPHSAKSGCRHGAAS
jgi:hypothetical protein